MNVAQNIWLLVHKLWGTAYSDISNATFTAPLAITIQSALVGVMSDTVGQGGPGTAETGARIARISTDSISFYSGWDVVMNRQYSYFIMAL